jgi:hypothetical protein
MSIIEPNSSVLIFLRLFLFDEPRVLNDQGHHLNYVEHENLVGGYTSQEHNRKNGQNPLQIGDKLSPWQLSLENRSDKAVCGDDCEKNYDRKQR